MKKKTTLLCILDGYGLNPNPEGNAIALANKPVMDRLLVNYPHSALITSGEAVGLPAGQMGNSEVGHLNIGAGRVVEQWLLRISRALEGSALSTSDTYKNFLQNSKSSKQIHLIGLYSTGGVHSHAEHLKLLIKKVTQDIPTPIVLHLISDGRDVSPTSFSNDLSELQVWLKDFPTVSISTICGRFFAMDRDKRWERVKTAYDAIACGKAAVSDDLVGYVKTSYEKGITDEFLEPAILKKAPIDPADSVIFWNFREDRMREITAALCIDSFNGFKREMARPKAENILCFTEYDHNFHLPFLCPQLPIANHLGEVVSKAGLAQLRVAETEKYPHVTYFFNGGIEKPYPGEERHLIPSPRDVKTYDQKPEMSAYPVTDVVVNGINSGNFDLIVVNLANCDMVGHTGSIPAAIKAVETVDECLGKMVDAITKQGGQALIIADHGNADQMINYEDGSPHTAHTTYPVPVILVSDSSSAVTLAKGGALCDVGPTILKLMGLPQPPEMTGKSLVS